MDGQRKTDKIKYGILIAAIVLVSFAGCGSSKDKEGADDPVVAEYREAKENLRQAVEDAQQYLPEDRRIDLDAPRETATEDMTYDSQDAPYEEAEPGPEPEAQPEADTSGENNVEVTTSKEDLQQMLKDNEGLTFYPEVPNDSTGKRRMGVYNSNTSQEKIALDYYKAFFDNDSELHALINPSNKTTACIQVLGDKLDVTITEYVDKEETDSDLMFSGTFYSEYNVDINSGEISKIQ